MEAHAMSGWNQAPYPRDQILLFRETLGDRIPDNHSVRLFAEILDQRDWSSWERRYVLVAGQPPIHPRIMAGAILYGLTHGLRSSRRLEWACGNAIDFMWLVEGRTIDHSTFCDFRTKFKRELKDLFRQIGRVAMHMGLIRLNQVALDGTRLKANSSRHATASAKTLEERLKALDEQIEKMLAEADQADQQDKDLFGDSVSGHTLPAELTDLKKRQERLRKAFQAAQQGDAKRAKSKNGSKRSVKVPVADPDSAIMPNKEGGYAPNFNPIAAADGECGMLVDADVLNEMREGETVIPTVERIESTFGRQPEQFLADSTFATGSNLSALAGRGIEAVMPVEQTQFLDENPTDRADPTQPVPEEDWPKLPRRAQTKKLDRAAFVYDAAKDCYYCPQGRPLEFVQIKTKGRDTGDASQYRVYACRSCEGCALAADCLAGHAKHRSVSHDQHEAVRRKVALRLKTESGKKTYARRAHLAETPNGFIKDVLGLRQFLLRGLDKVRTEWLWACTAFNIRKLMIAMEKLRADTSLEPV
ncbi:MAG: IS1182 family transposase [Rhodothermia bacterium]